MRTCKVVSNKGVAITLWESIFIMSMYLNDKFDNPIYKAINVCGLIGGLQQELRGDTRRARKAHEQASVGGEGGVRGADKKVFQCHLQIILSAEEEVH